MINTLSMSLNCEKELFDCFVRQLLDDGLEDKIRACGAANVEVISTSNVTIRSRGAWVDPIPPADPAD